MVPYRSAIHIHAIDKLTVCHLGRTETHNPDSITSDNLQIKRDTEIENVSESYKSLTPESLLVSYRQSLRKLEANYINIHLHAVIVNFVHSYVMSCPQSNKACESPRGGGIAR